MNRATKPSRLRAMILLPHGTYWIRSRRIIVTDAGVFIWRNYAPKPQGPMGGRWMPVVERHAEAEAWYLFHANIQNPHWMPKPHHQIVP